MRRAPLLRAAALGLALLPGPAVGATPPPAAYPVPGDYRQAAPATRKPLDVGSRLVIIAGKGGRLGFSLNAVRALDSNQGFIAGLLRGPLPITWTQSGAGGNCRLLFEAIPGGYRIEQDLTFGDCGFGGGVTADGLYLRDASAKG